MFILEKCIVKNINVIGVRMGQLLFVFKSYCKQEVRMYMCTNMLCKCNVCKVLVCVYVYVCMPVCMYDIWQST